MGGGALNRDRELVCLPPDCIPGQITVHLEHLFIDGNLAADLRPKVGAMMETDLQALRETELPGSSGEKVQGVLLGPTSLGVPVSTSLGGSSTLEYILGRLADVTLAGRGVYEKLEGLRNGRGQASFVRVRLIYTVGLH